MSDWAGLVWLAVLLVVNALFVAAEFAVVSARRSQIEPRAAAGSRPAKTALWAIENTTLMLAACQLGITVCSLLILNVSEPAIHHLVEEPLGLTGWPDEVVNGVAFVIALIVVSFLHVVIGEMVPKNISFSLSERAILLLATPLVGFATVVRPVILALNATANGVLRLVGVEPKSETTSAFTLEEVQNIVRTSQREGVLADTTGALGAAFEFTEKRVRDVAIAPDLVVTLAESATPRDIEVAVAEHGFSRFVIVDDEGEPVGYLHLKDVLDLDQSEYSEPVPTRRIRRLVAVGAEADLEDALALMRRTGTHLARAVGEDGALAGILFLEDIIEELVGEVEDATRRSAVSAAADPPDGDAARDDDA